MSSQPIGIPLTFNTSSKDEFGFFVPLSENVKLISGGIVYPVTGYRIKTNTTKPLKFNITGSFDLFLDIASFNSISGSVQLLKTKYPKTANSSGERFIAGEEVAEQVFIKSTFSLETVNTPFQVTASDTASTDDFYFLFLRKLFNATGTRNPDRVTGSFDFFISSSVEGTPKEVVLEPFFTTKFFGSDCDVLYGEATKGIPNRLLQKVNYNSGPIPSNITTLIDGTAENVDIPQSNYTQLSSINHKYRGSKVQSSDFNTYDTSKDPTYNVFLINKSNPYFHSLFNKGTLGQTPSVSTLNTNIFEYNWGGGTAPEIIGGGGVKLGNILNVNTKDSATIINPSEGLTNISIPVSLPIGGQTKLSSWNRSASIFQNVSEYYYTLNGNIQPGDEISFYPYPNQSNAGSNPTIPTTTKVLTTEFTVPSNSTFLLTSSAHSEAFPKGIGELVYWNNIAGTASATLEAFDALGDPYKISYVKLFDDRVLNVIKSDYKTRYGVLPGEFLMTGSSPIFPGTTPATTASFTPISTQLNEGERWFFTFFKDFQPYDSNGNFDSSNIEPFRYSESPLGKKGVVEIVGIYRLKTGFDIFDRSSNGDVFILLKEPLNPISGFRSGIAYSGSTWGTGAPNGPLLPSDSSGVIDNLFSYRIGGGSSDINIYDRGLGFLMWKAKGVGKNSFVLVDDLITGGVAAGAFTSKFVSPEITENLEKITKEFGNNNPS
tara:strand:+ start:684 stop:2831 length:2148 start_codon:yes stop_codon:yes gene_type:complete